MGLFNKKTSLVSLFSRSELPEDMKNSGKEITFWFDSGNQTFMMWVLDKNGEIKEVPHNQTKIEVPLLKISNKDLNNCAQKMIQKAAEHSSNRTWSNERFVKIDKIKYAIAPAEQLGFFCDGGAFGKGLIIINTSAVRKVEL
jgi:hypothetical protein